MSGFQIPGLGFAKPNETLPPLPPNVQGATTGVNDKNDASNANAEPTEDIKMEGTATTEAEPVTATVAQPAAAPEQAKSNDPEPMSVDTVMAPDTTETASLTDALEAMISGLEPAPAAQAAATTTTAATTTAPVTEQSSTAEQPTGESEHPEWEMDSSPYESSSESSSDSSSDDDSDAGEGYQPLGIEETARMLMEEIERESDDEGRAKGAGANIVRTKNEAEIEAPPKPDITLTPEDKIEQLGVVDQIVGNIILIQAFTPGEYQVLDSGSVLCTEDRKVFGVIWETIGQVQQPMYTVVFPTPEDVQEAGLALGTKVCYPKAHATVVFTQALKNVKGSDASNMHDEEVTEDEMEFSDDEKEAEHKRLAKQKKKEAWLQSGGEERAAERASRREPHPLRNEIGGLNYDDEDDGPYKPLARPPGFGQVPPTQQTFSQEPEPGRFGGRRGGRGDFRGRGDRGRGDRGRGGRGRGRGGFGQHGGDSRDGYSMPPQGQRYQNDAPQGQWGGNSSQTQGYNPQQQQQQQSAPPAPAAPSFNFSFPGLPPQPGQGGFVPPPPPGWPQTGQPQSQNPAQAYALFAALMQMQQNQQPQQGGNQQQPPQPPPHPFGAPPPPQ